MLDWAGAFCNNLQLRNNFMGLLDSIFSAVAASAGGESNPLFSAVEGIFLQNGGLEGLKNKFTKEGLGDIFSSWVGLEENLPISAEQIQKVLGVAQVQALASKIGIDAAKAPDLLAGYLPKIIDKLSPTGELPTDPAALKAGVACLMPALLKSLIGGHLSA